MAADAGVLRDHFVTRLDLNRVVIILRGESNRMKQAVVSFCDPLADEVVRKMAVVAGCNVVMTAVLPRIVVFLHDMAVGT